jgi:hypothetical protein
MRFRYLLIIAIFLAAASLSLVRLDNTYFWDDEALTAIGAKNLLLTGHLTGWDGRNLVAYHNGTLLDKDLRLVGSPPLHHLIAAASFRLFGMSTWSGRFPFVLAGLASLCVLSLILRQEYSAASHICIYGTAVMATSISYLLNIRQCRYYSLAMLFSLLTFFMYRQCIRSSRLAYYILLAISAVLLFYSNFLLCAAFLAALALLCMVFHRDDLRKNIAKFSIAFFLFILATVPYAVINRIWYRPDVQYEGEPLHVWKLSLLWWNLRELNLLGFMPWMVAAGLLYFMIRYRRKCNEAAMALQWSVLCLGYVVSLVCMSYSHVVKTAIGDDRYLIPTLPFLCGLTGVFLWFVHSRTRIGAMAILILIVTTNLLSVTPTNWKFQLRLPAYIDEVLHDYPTAYSQAVQFLSENVKQDEKVFAWPEYANYPIMFYLGDKVKMCCTLYSTSHIPQDTIESLNAPLLVDENFPDWFILFGMDSRADERISFFSREHLYEGQQIQLSYRLVKVLDVYWFDSSRPELPWHTFGPRTGFDRQREAVYVMRCVGKKN